MPHLPEDPASQQPLEQTCGWLDERLLYLADDDDDDDDGGDGGGDK